MNLTDWAEHCHALSRNAGWWDIPSHLTEKFEGYGVDSSKPIVRRMITPDQWRDLVTPTKISLIHSEVSEAMEGFRKGLNDDHLPYRKMAEVELADALIRIFDLAGAWGYDLEAAVQEKLAYNQKRPDHQPDARAADGGKKF